jgi:hypothetical protein
LEVKLLGYGADHSPPSSAVVKNEWIYTTFPWDFMACTEVTLLFLIALGCKTLGAVYMCSKTENKKFKKELCKLFI